MTFYVVQVVDSSGGFTRWVNDCEVDDQAEASEIVADLRAQGVTARYVPRYEPD